VNERQAADVSNGAEGTDVEDPPLHRQEIGKTTRGRPLGQTVGMTIADRDRPVEPDAAGASGHERCDRAVVG
jgi:hypothetical protein